MKNTYGDADAKDSTEIALEKQLSALRAENEILVRERDNALFQVHGLIAQLQEKSAENAKLRGTLKNLLTNCELGHWSKYVREILAQTTEAHVTPDPLYAAAPEMMEALELVVGEGISHKEFFPACMAAIAKAKGEPIP